MLNLMNRSRFARFLIGLILMIALVWAGFAISIALIPTYGANAEEIHLLLPGDEILPNSPINWRHAITIHAAPEEVWTWIIQMGDKRAAFYSYQFIERMVDPTPGLYFNADRVHAEWQNPEKGASIISTALYISDYEPGRYLLASAPRDDPNAMGWTWLWHIAPTPSGGTRLNVHMHIQPVAGPSNPLLDHFIGLGAFIMERNMMSGLKVRAEGGGEPAWIEGAEIAIWMLALLAGFAAAGRYIFSQRWQAPLVIALSAVVMLFVFTFLQPAVLLRAIIDLALLGALAWTWYERKAPARQKQGAFQVA